MKKILVTCMGSFVQWFDNTLFQVLVPLIIFNFVPKSDQLSTSFGLIMAYSASLFTRPFGAIIFGHLADQFGRKKILLITPFVMGSSMLFLSLCPSEKIIGVAAPSFLLLLTFLHGFSSGAEWTVSSCFLDEQYKASWYPKTGLILSSFLLLGIFFADLIFGAIFYVRSPEFIAQFSWRMLFLFSASLSFMTLYLRRNLIENGLQTHKKRVGAFKSLIVNRKNVVLAFLVCGLDGILFNLIFNNLYPYKDEITSRALSFVSISIVLTSAYMIFKLTKYLGVMTSVKLSAFFCVLLGILQIVFPYQDYILVVKIIYCFPAFMFLVAITTLLPALFEKENRAFLIAISRSSAIFLFGGLGLVSLRLWIPLSNMILAIYVVFVSSLSLYASILLSKKKLSIY